MIAGCPNTQKSNMKLSELVHPSISVMHNAHMAIRACVHK